MVYIPTYMTDTQFLYSICMKESMPVFCVWLFHWQNELFASHFAINLCISFFLMAKLHLHTHIHTDT